MTQKSIINKVSSLKQQAKEKYKAEIKAVFGSVVTDAFKSTSDIDILVRFKGRKSLFDLVRLERELEKNLDKKVDLLTYKSINHLLKERIMQEDVRII